MDKLTQSECANMSEAHFLVLPSQSNIYGLTKLPMCGGPTKVLVSSLRSQVFSMEYAHNSSGELTPHAKEVEFTYIPNAAEIISMDAFRKFDDKNEFVVGITLVKNQDNKQSCYLNIYSNWEPGTNLSVEGLGQYCLTLELNFVPFHLYHTDVYGSDRTDTVFLLSGSDKAIHLFIDHCNNHNFAETAVTEKFPEFAEFPSIVRWMDIAYINDRKTRLSAVGCEDGYIRASIVDVESLNVVNTYSIYHDCCISAVLWFKHRNSPAPPPQDVGALDRVASSLNQAQAAAVAGKPAAVVGSEYRLVVSSTIELAVVYRNVVELGFEDQVILPDSDLYDCVNCCHVADIDLDGTNEIVLGTYGHMLMAFKEEDAGEYASLWQRKFSHPVLACLSVDVTGDGVEEMVVMSTKGVHVLQHDLRAVQRLLQHRMQRFLEFKRRMEEKKQADKNAASK